MFREIFIIYNCQNWKQPKNALMDEYINKVWYKHLREYYAALKRKGILTYAITWMYLEDIRIREIRQSQ